MAQPKISDTAGAILGSLALLLVEDDRINQMVAAALLEGDGYAVTIARDGIDALEKATSRRFDAILMDVMMPRLDGIDAARRLRAEAGPNQSTPIIALTANAGERDRYLAAGMNDCLSKPFDLETVRSVVAYWIDAERAEAAPAAKPDRPGDEAAVLDEGWLAGLEARVAAPKVAAMIRTFLDNAEQRLQRLGDAGAARDLETVEREAHSLVGAAANFGALRLAAAARRIEAACRAADPVGVDRGADQLSIELAAARQALTRRFLEREAG